LGIFDAEIVLPAAEAEPHLPDGRNVRRAPVGIAAVGDDRPQAADTPVFVLDRPLEPAVAAKIQRDARLIEAAAVVELRLHREGKELLTRLKLQDGRAVVAEVIVRPLP